MRILKKSLFAPSRYKGFFVSLVHRQPRFLSHSSTYDLIREALRRQSKEVKSFRGATRSLVATI